MPNFTAYFVPSSFDTYFRLASFLHSASFKEENHEPTLNRYLNHCEIIVRIENLTAWIAETFKKKVWTKLRAVFRFHEAISYLLMFEIEPTVKYRLAHNILPNHCEEETQTVWTWKHIHEILGQSFNFKYTIYLYLYFIVQSDRSVCFKFDWWW